MARTGQWDTRKPACAWTEEHQERRQYSLNAHAVARGRMRSHYLQTRELQGANAGCSSAQGRCIDARGKGSAVVEDSWQSGIWTSCTKVVFCT